MQKKQFLIGIILFLLMLYSTGIINVFSFFSNGITNNNSNNNVQNYGYGYGYGY